MSHEHHNHHNHSHSGNKKVLRISFVIIATYMVVEIIGGLLTNSLALLSDAGHMFSDAAALGLSLLAFHFGERPGSRSNTFGYKRFEILAALLNGLTLMLIAVWIVYEAVGRFANPPEIATTGMLVVSVIGLLVNIFVAWYMHRGGDTEENINMRGAYLHVLGDLLGSVGAIAAAVLMMSAAKAAELGLTPMARVAGYALSGCAPEIMGMGPVSASQKALAKAGWAVEDLDLVEANEAFAAQALGVTRELKWDLNKVNVNGGAIALGHPIGASGCRVLVTLLHEMQRRDAKKGLATLCIGGGMGVSLAVER